MPRRGAWGEDRKAAWAIEGHAVAGGGCYMVGGQVHAKPRSKGASTDEERSGMPALRNDVRAAAAPAAWVGVAASTPGCHARCVASSAGCLRDPGELCSPGASKCGGTLRGEVRKEFGAGRGGALVGF